jgi:hypothetical protein
MWTRLPKGCGGKRRCRLGNGPLTWRAVRDQLHTEQWGKIIKMYLFATVLGKTQTRSWRLISGLNFNPYH